MKFLLLLLILSGCGKKIIYTDPSAPADQATLQMKSDIDQELVQIEKDFADIDVNLDLHRLPVIVSPLPFGVVGRCQYGKDNQGIFIVLSPMLFPMAEGFLPTDNDLFEKDFVKVLLHEIGHCYFKRGHDEPLFIERPGQALELHHEGRAVVFDRIPKSLMPAESMYRMPKALRRYYIAELAGKAEVETPENLAEFTELQIVNHFDMKNDNPSGTVEPAEI